MHISTGRGRLSDLRAAAASVLAPVVRRLASPGGRGLYVAAGLLIGLVNLALMVILDPATPVRLAFLLLAPLTLAAVPLRPVPGALAYLVLWVVLLNTPGPPASDVTVTNAALYFFLGRFLPLRAALALGAVMPLAVVVPAGPLDTVAAQLSLMAFTLPPGALLRHRETALRQEVTEVTRRLSAVRTEVAREMHDLVAYSMSQTVLRARRAAADPSYPEEARQELAAIGATAADALHELRLVLQVLRRVTEDAPPGGPSTGLGSVVVDLDAAVRTVADDLSASGFTVTYQTRGRGGCPRLQATTLSRVAREMGANILRHGTTHQPVTITLSQGAEQVRLVMTNGVAPEPLHALPTSGSGILGMQERLAAIGGSLSTLEEAGTWLVSASAPLPPPADPPQEPS